MSFGGHGGLGRCRGRRDGSAHPRPCPWQALRGGDSAVPLLRTPVQEPDRTRDRVEPQQPCPDHSDAHGAGGDRRLRQGDRGQCPDRGGQLDTDEHEQRAVEQVTGHLPEGDDLDPGAGTDDARAEPGGHKAAGVDGEDAGHVQRFGGQVGEERRGDTQHAVEQGLGWPAPDGDQEQCDRGTDHDSAGVGLDESERRTGPGEGSPVGDDLDDHGQQDIGDSANPAKAGVSPTRQPAPSSGSGSLRPVRRDGRPVASTPTATTTISSGLPTSVPFVFMAPRSRPDARVTGHDFLRSCVPGSPAPALSRTRRG